MPDIKISDTNFDDALYEYVIRAQRRIGAVVERIALRGFWSASRLNEEHIEPINFEYKWRGYLIHFVPELKSDAEITCTLLDAEDDYYDAVLKFNHKEE